MQQQTEMPMQQKSIEYLKNILSNWEKIDVRTVPSVMHQALCMTENTDNSTEYRFHWFLDATETYVHNHRYASDTYCLEGGYIENIWEINDDHSGASVCKFPRTSENQFGSMTCVPGVLRIVKSRDHFPENTLHVDPDQFHSVVAKTGSKNVLTFVARRICSTAAKNTFVLSHTGTIEAPTHKIRLATSAERQDLYDKLRQTYQRLVNNPNAELSSNQTQ